MSNIYLDFSSILGSRYLNKSETNTAMKLALNVALKLALNAALKLALNTD